MPIEHTTVIVSVHAERGEDTGRPPAHAPALADRRIPSVFIPGPRGRAEEG